MRWILAKLMKNENNYNKINEKIRIITIKVIKNENNVRILMKNENNFSKIYEK